VLCQFTDSDQRNTLARYLDRPEHRGFYPAGRLDRDSEGLVVLTNHGGLQDQIAHPRHSHSKVYWVQVEGDIGEEALRKLQRGVELKDGLTKPAKAKRIDEPDIWPRSTPIRERKNIPTSWVEFEIKEGRNRQVRRMTAAVGFPTLRLVRYSVSSWSLSQKNMYLRPGEFALLDVDVSNLPAPSNRKSLRKNAFKAKSKTTHSNKKFVSKNRSSKARKK